MKRILFLLTLIFSFVEIQAQIPQIIKAYTSVSDLEDAKVDVGVSAIVDVADLGGLVTSEDIGSLTVDHINIFETADPTKVWVRTVYGQVSGDTTIVNNTVINKSIRIPRTDTTSAVQKTGSIIYDTILDHYYGYIHGSDYHWRCLDCDVAGVTVFTGLTDVPSSYSGQALKAVRVNAGATALEFYTPSGGGDLLSTNNLSDVASASTSRTNLGLAIGTDVQAYDADLTTYAGITPSANVQTLLGSADYSAFRTSLGLGSSATHASSDYLLVSNNLSEGTPATMRTNLGLGSFATLNNPATTNKDFIYYDGSAYQRLATGSNGQHLIVNGSGNYQWVDSSAASGGITTLNTLTASTQTFATGTSGSDFNISSATSTHTFNIPDASASNRGLVTTGAQIFGGVKTFTNPVINVGSDATGDVYYRNSGGLYTRLPIGSNGQIFGVVSGLPAWSTIGVTDTLAHTIYARTDAVNTVKLTLADTTSATSSVQQWSPALRFTAQGWKSGAPTGSHTVDFQIWNYTQSQTAGPDGKLVFQSRRDGGGWSDIMYLNDQISSPFPVDILGGATRIRGYISFTNSGNSSEYFRIVPGSSVTYISPVAASASGIVVSPSGLGAGQNSLATGTQFLFKVNPSYNQFTAPNNANNYDIVVDRTETAVGSGTQRLFSGQVGSTEYFGVDNKGQLWQQGTITTAGTTGAQTINKPIGSVNFAAGATSLVVTNSLVTTSSLVFCQIMTNDATATSTQVVAGSGSFTIYLNAAATAETKVAFEVKGKD